MIRWCHCIGYYLTTYCFWEANKTIWDKRILMTGSFNEVYLSITKPFKCNKRESMSVYENDKPRIIMQNNTSPIAT